LKSYLNIRRFFEKLSSNQACSSDEKFICLDLLTGCTCNSDFSQSKTQLVTEQNQKKARMKFRAFFPDGKVKKR